MIYRVHPDSFLCLPLSRIASHLEMTAATINNEAPDV